MKEKEAKRIAIEKTKIEVLIQKHRPGIPKTPDKVDLTGTGSNPNDIEGPKKVQPPYKKAIRLSPPKIKVQNLMLVNQIHC